MREDFFTNEPDVPLYFKLRTIILRNFDDMDNAACARVLGKRLVEKAKTHI